jgi:Uncharacterized protein conserved in bacteria (DUF2325)
LIHHDGGVEDATGRLNGILTQGDAVLCAMDCVSHDACWRAKRLCKQRTKAFIPLRSASLSSFVGALRMLTAEPIAAEPDESASGA